MLIYEQETYQRIHRSQAINYAKIAGFNLSLLINFGESSLVKERFPIR